MNNFASAKIRLLAFLIESEVYLAIYLLVILKILSSDSIETFLDSLLFLPALFIFMRILLHNYIGYMVSSALFFLGFFWVVKDKMKRAWHDMMAGSFVVVKPGFNPITLFCFTFLAVINIYLGALCYTAFLNNFPFYKGIYEDFIESKKDNSPQINPKSADLVQARVFNDYKSYTNADKKISFLYPPDWTTEDALTGSIVVFFKSPLESGDNFPANVNLSIQDLTGYNINLGQYTKLSLEQINSLSTDLKILKGPEKTVLLGQSADSMEYTGRQGEMMGIHWKQAWVIKDSRAYILSYTSLESDFEKYKQEAENIFSSFSLLP